MNGGSFTVVRIRGVPVRVHWTLLLILPYIAIVFSIDFARVSDLAGLPAGRLVLPPLLWGAFLALALFASVAVHELAHTLVAIRAGGRVRGITLMLVGGVSQIERMPPKRGMEALMAAAGPATSLALGAALLALLHLVPSGVPDLKLGLFYLGQMNLVLGVFNLVPAFPMDGGRVLRALVATRLGGVRATRIAAVTGKVFAVLMALLGLWSGNFLLLLIAVFIYTGAGQELRAEETRGAIEALRVADLMTPDPPAVELDAPVAELPSRMRAAARLELVVVDDLGHPVGLVRAADVRGLSPVDRARLHVADLGIQLSRTAVLARPDEPAAVALDRAHEAGVDHIVAVDAADHLTGLIDRREVERALLLRELDRRDAA